MATVMQACETSPSPDEMVPAILVRSCVAVLPVAGAGLSIIAELRVPLAASDHLVVLAERLQTSLGDGPCLTATDSGQPVVADDQTLAARWPLFHRELHRQTPFRSVASLPLQNLHQHGLGALDLYSEDPDAFSSAWLQQVNVDVGDPIAAILFDNPSAAHLTGEPPTAGSTGGSGPNQAIVQNRLRIWLAVGMVMERAGLVNADALAALRAYAFSHDATLEHVAELVTTSQLDPDRLLR